MTTNATANASVLTHVVVHADQLEYLGFGNSQNPQEPCWVEDRFVNAYTEEKREDIDLVIGGVWEDAACTSGVVAEPALYRGRWEEGVGVG